MKPIIYLILSLLVVGLAESALARQPDGSAASEEEAPGGEGLADLFFWGGAGRAF